MFFITDELSLCCGQPERAYGSDGKMKQLTPGWRKSSYSGNGRANCVETGNSPGMVLVRATINRGGGTLAFSASAWHAFTSNVKHS